MSTARFWSEVAMDAGKNYGIFEESPKRVKVEDDEASADVVDPSTVVHFEDQVEGLSKEEIVAGLSAVLELQCARNAETAEDDKVSRAETLSMFYSSFKQKFGMDFYVRRLIMYMDCSNAVFLVAFCYLDRIQNSHPHVRLTSYNIHRYLMTAALLAAKYLDDDTYTNRYYAKVGGVSSLAEMNALETRMLNLLDWRLDVSPASLQYYNEYIRLIARI
eukprot:Plantae.Rhodophyta-Purpureofilum_apyrenoidigerum.ctg31472.p1 GENE.Plantae.Rhodophyta-Purpureofilum_apyrenoidigerum.ctg31472~~Plantae.Rhodophyta-Purpureofilum_apyrenoidigerum.ctg31472.p1  ORF type:complete len:218 (+),score=50.38 Plantae.Rhodophyta-Purpureofilum_apyrenoidigerum.ctg31472:160-813(+)